MKRQISRLKDCQEDMKQSVTWNLLTNTYILYVYILYVYMYIYIYITYIMYIIYIYISPMPLHSYVHMYLSTWQNSTLKTHFILQIFCSHLGSFLCASNFTVLFKSNFTIFASNFTILLYIFVEWRVRE